MTQMGTDERMDSLSARKGRIAVILDERQAPKLWIAPTLLRLMHALVLLTVAIQPIPIQAEEADRSEPVETMSLIGSQSYSTATVADAMTPGIALHLDVQDDYVYLASGWLRVVDVTIPEQPRQVGLYDGTSRIWRVQVRGDYAYVTDGDLRILDVSQPANPSEVGFHEIQGEARGIDVAGSHAYVGESKVGLHVIDVLDPTKPQEVGFCEIQGHIQNVHVSDGLAFVAVTSFEKGLWILNVVNPMNPYRMGFLRTDARVFDVDVAGRHAYLAVDGMEQLRVVDVSNPSNPREVGTCEISGDTGGRDIQVVDDYVYLAGSAGGIRVIDISIPPMPVEVDHFITPSRALGLRVIDNRIYVADGGAGLSIVQHHMPSAASKPERESQPVHPRHR